MIVAVFKTILPLDVLRLFDGFLAQQRTASFQFVLFVLAIKTIAANQNGIGLGDMLQESIDEFIDGKGHELALLAAIVKRNLGISNFDNPAVKSDRP